MARGRTPIFSFNGGELSRRMEGRADLDGIYDRALATMLNFVATVEGPAMKRPGFRYIKAASSSSTWLTPFIFNTLQSYVLEWGEQAIRFYTNGGEIEAGGAPYVLAVPYTAAEAPRISAFQSYDRLYCAHPAHPPGMVQRTGAEAFAFNWIPLKNGPFKDWNTDKQATISWTGTGLVDDIVTLTASRPIFKEGHVGGFFIFEVKDYSDIKAWEPQVRAEEIALGEKVRSDGKVYSLVARSPLDGTNKIYTGTIEPTHTEGDEWDGSTREVPGGDGVNDYCGCKWRYQYDRFGIGQITEFVNASSVKLKVTRRLPDLAVATYKWAHGCFSNAEGWPHLVTVWGGRLVFFKGTELMASVTGDYFNFSPITTGGIYAPDMAFRRALGIADPPLWVHADKEYLLAGCSRSEVMVGQVNRAEGISSSNLQAQPQSGYGSAEVWPVAVGTSVLLVQRGGRKIRELGFGYEQERFAGPNLNIFARHITRSGVKWLSFQQEPEQMLWAGRGDGTLIAHPHSPEQQVKGFARVALGAGVAISGCSIPSTDGTRDELWILADLDGEKAVLQLGEWWDEDAGTPIADSFFVDWGVSYAGDPKAEFTEGLDHLEGREVRILADGSIHRPLTVTGGALTLDKPASKVHIGVGYDARLKLLRPAVRNAPGAGQGLRARIIRVLARLIDAGPLRILDERGNSDPLFSKNNALFNGDTDDRATGAGSSFNPSGEIVSSDPLPAIVSMAIATYDLEDPK